MLRRIDKPTLLRQNKSADEGRRNYHLHDRANGSLDVDSVIPVDRDQTCLATDDGEIDESAVIIHAELDLFETFRQNPVKLAWENGSVS